MEKIPRSFGTHCGVFHADEVTACALLYLFKLIDEDKIVRSRDPNLLAKCEYVCDVGGIYDSNIKAFDHHQVDYEGELSSAGMVLSYLKDSQLISADDFLFLHRSLIAGVDAHDNGVIDLPPGVCSYSDLIANFTPINHEAHASSQDCAFMEAFYFARDHLDRLLRRRQYVRACRSSVAEVMKQGGEYLLFDHSIPWMESFFELGGKGHPAKFIIMPTGEHWKLRAIPPSLERSMLVRLPLPIEWAGLLEEQLQKVSGIEGALFCHKGRFISIWKTRGDALRALNYVLEGYKEGR